MTNALWILLFIQMIMGAFDTIYHHEGTERLAWRASQRVELYLHGARNLLYAVMFFTLGWFIPKGFWAGALLALLAAELIITLWDFVEEDRSRDLPASERVTHTLLTLNYGIILALLVPWLFSNAGQATAIEPAYYGLASWVCALASMGVIVSGLRDLAAAKRTERLTDHDPARLSAILPPRQSILVTGGTGFIGSRLVRSLVNSGHDVTVLTRNRAKALPLLAEKTLRIVTSLDEIGSHERIDAIVNLAGEQISDTPWTKAKRFRIILSRLETTYAILRLVDRMTYKPSVLVSGSAIGWYGLRGDEALTERDSGTNCFSRRVCKSWERAALRIERHGVRVVLLRTGLVLDREGGMLARLLTPFEFGLGGRFGDGKHWMSWIHRDDLVRLICHIMATDTVQGPVNATAPEPVTNREFTTTLGSALRRPSIATIPAWPLRLMLGGFADELLLHGQRVLPDLAVRSGFEFEYPNLDLALNQIVGNADRRPSKSAETSAQLRYDEAALKADVLPTLK